MASKKRRKVSAENSDAEWEPQFVATWYEVEDPYAAAEIQEHNQYLREETRARIRRRGSGLDRYHVHYTEIHSGTIVHDRFDNTLEVLDDHTGLVHEVKLIKGEPNERSKFVFTWRDAQLPGERRWRDIVLPGFVREAG